MKKKLVINAANCDARKVQEETLQAYEKIVINSAIVLTDERVQALFAKYPVEINGAKVLNLQGDVQLRTVNGSAQIKSGVVPAEKQYLIANGALEIGPDTQNVLEQYVGILVNGSVTYPESISSALGMMTVNGSANCYPDGAVLLKRNAVIDRLFALRAKENLYWAGKRLIMVDPQLDPEALAAKGARFSSREAILAESKVEGLINLIDERADIIIVPDGTAVVLDDVALDDVVLKKYGSKLYIIGNVTVDQNSANALERMEYLNIRGDASVTNEMKERFLEAVHEIRGEVKISRGRRICDKISFRITKWMLEREKDGISVEDCATVTIDADVEKELIMDRLTITDCASVKCTPEQVDAVTAICTDCGQIGDDSKGAGDMIKEASGVVAGQNGILGMAKDLLDCRIINTAEYVM